MSQHPIRPSQPSPSEEKAEFRAMLGKRLAVGCALALVFLLLGGMTYVVVAIRESQVQGAPIRDATARAAADAATAAHLAQVGTKRIEDCTTPGRPCSNRSARQAASYISTIDARNKQTAAIAAAAGADCASKFTGYTGIYRCIVRRLDASTTSEERKGH